jgi:hypothetical protein
MIKQLGWIAVAASALAALSACDGQTKPVPAPTETKATTPEVVETIHVEPEAKQRFELTTMGKFETIGPVGNAPVVAQPQTNTIPIDEQKLKAAAHKAGALPQIPVATTAIGGAK